jgi:hypothetical protein
MNGLPSLSATRAPCAIAPVATPAISSASGYRSLIRVEKESRINDRTSGKERVFRLSQYIGDFHPEAHVKGFDGCNFIALICKRYSAVFFAIFSI